MTDDEQEGMIRDLRRLAPRDRRRMAPGHWSDDDIDCLLRQIDALRAAARPALPVELREAFAQLRLKWAQQNMLFGGTIGWQLECERGTANLDAIYRGKGQ